MGGLGFRRIHEFNLSLLGKQAWRLVSRPETLVSKIFKARYFPKTTFSEAKLGGNPSFLWRSILAAQEVIRRGSRWMVGDGNLINIWSDAWLPRENNLYIISECPEGLENEKVCGLLNQQTGDWDVDCVHDLMNEEDYNMVLNIPRSKRIGSDKLIWAWEEKGIYSVKSCYKEVACCVPPICDLSWTRGWKLEIPPKVKHFFWLVCTECLSTLDLLQRRGVNIPSVRGLCNEDHEMTNHLFMSCRFTRECWVGANGISPPNDGVTVKDWFAEMLRSKDSEKACLAIMVCWSIWKGRNDKCWNGVNFAAFQVINQAVSFLQNWREVMKKEGRTGSSSTQVKWRRPLSGRVKLNIDAAIDVEGKRMEFGWILRDSEGSFIGAKGIQWNGVFQAKEAEAISIREALTWIKSMGVDVVDVETDSQLVTNALNSSHFDTYFGTLISDIKEAANVFVDISFGFVKRSANRASHRVAREVVSLPDPVEWLVVPPVFLESVLADDIMN